MKDGKSSFRSGEEIVLEISVRTSGSGCFVVSDTQPSPMDKIELTPTDGAYRWVQDDGRGSDASAWMQMEANKPATIRIVLNDLYRFDERETYTVKVRFTRFTRKTLRVTAGRMDDWRLRSWMPSYTGDLEF